MAGQENRLHPSLQHQGGWWHALPWVGHQPGSLRHAELPVLPVRINLYWAHPLWAKHCSRQERQWIKCIGSLLSWGRANIHLRCTVVERSKKKNEAWPKGRDEEVFLCLLLDPQQAAHGLAHNGHSINIHCQLTDGIRNFQRGLTTKRQRKMGRFGDWDFWPCFLDARPQVCGWNQQNHL